MTDRQGVDAERARRVARVAGGAVVAAALVGGGWWLVGSGGDDLGAGQAGSVPVVAPSTTRVQVTVVVVPDATTPDAAGASTSDVASTTTVAQGPTTTSVPIPTLSVPASTAADPIVAYATIENGSVSVRGSVPDEATRAALVAQLADAVGAAVDDRLTIDPAAPVTDRVPLYVPGAALFEPDSAKLLGDAKGALDIVARIVTRSTDSNLLIRGHTDDRGSEAYNFALSQQRVAAVFAYLVDQGIPAARLRLDPRGEVEPIADNSTEAGRAANRRVELLLVPA